MAAFTKGDSRINRAGRPRKNKSFTETIEKYALQKRENGESNREALVRVLFDLAIVDKNLGAIKYITDRVDGKPRENPTLKHGKKHG
jgi:hypothetical protein